MPEIGLASATKLNPQSCQLLVHRLHVFLCRAGKLGGKRDGFLVEDAISFGAFELWAGLQPVTGIVLLFTKSEKSKWAAYHFQVSASISLQVFDRAIIASLVPGASSIRMVVLSSRRAANSSMII